VSGDEQQDQDDSFLPYLHVFLHLIVTATYFPKVKYPLPWREGMKGRGISLTEIHNHFLQPSLIKGE
jgi:hypothetical protein